MFKKPMGFLKDYITLRNNAPYYILRRGTHIIAKNADDLGTIFETCAKQEYGSDFSSYNVIVDIGANTGIPTMWFAERSKAKIYAMEPFPFCIQQIQENVKINHLEDRVFPIQVAVSDTDGETQLYITDQTLTSSLLENFADDQKGSMTVRTATLKSLMDENNIEHIDLLKLDCEGSEYLIIDSLDSETATRIGEIRMEYHNVDNDQMNGRAVLEKLKNLGFFITRAKLHTDQRATAGFIWGKRK